VDLCWGCARGIRSKGNCFRHFLVNACSLGIKEGNSSNALYSRSTWLQGEEAKVVVLSLVRNNRDGIIGFLKMQNRINVLLSRAQHGMYLLGSMSTLLRGAGDRAPMWRTVLSILSERGCVVRSLQVRAKALHSSIVRGWGEGWSG
jgi:hypothetical protein